MTKHRSRLDDRTPLDDGARVDLIADHLLALRVQTAHIKAIANRPPTSRSTPANAAHLEHTAAIADRYIAALWRLIFDADIPAAGPQR